MLQISLNCRGDSSSSSSTVGERLLSTLLTEMDGLEEAKVSVHFFLFGEHFTLPPCPLLFTAEFFYQRKNKVSIKLDSRER